MCVIFYIIILGSRKSYRKKSKKKATLFECFSLSILTQTTIGYGIPESIGDTKSPLFKFINILHMSSIFFILALIL